MLLPAAHADQHTQMEFSSDFHEVQRTQVTGTHVVQQKEGCECLPAEGGTRIVQGGAHSI